MTKIMETKKSNTDKTLSIEEILLFILYLCGSIIGTAPVWYNFYRLVIE